MLRFLLSLCLMLVSQTNLPAQINADSLLQLANAIEGEAARAKALEGYVVGKKFSDFNNPLPLFLARWELAKKAGDAQREAMTALDVIQSGNFIGAYALADSLSFLYAERAETLANPRTKVDIYHEAAKAAFFAQAYAASIRYDSAGLLLLPEVQPVRVRDSLQGRIQNYLGKSFNASGQFVPAATVLTDAIEFVRSTRPDTSLLLELYTELGIVYSQIGLYDQAVEYLDLSAQYGTALPPENKVGVQVNIGRNLLLTKAYAAARDRYRKAMAIPMREAQTFIVNPYVYNGLVEAYYRMNNRDSVDYYFSMFQAYLDANPEQKEVNPFLFQQSSWLSHLMNNRLAEAEKVGKVLMAQAQAAKDPADLLYYTELLAETYRRQGNYRQADALSQELITRKDSIQSANRNDALLLYYNQFETQEKENEILRLDAERARISARSRLFLTAAGLLGLLLLTSLFFFFKLRKARAALAEQNIQLGKLNATKDRFFGIIAHDLRNPIAALKTADRQVNRLYDRGRTEEVRSVVGSIV